MTAEFLTESQVAERLGRSRKWFSDHRTALEREGFPRKDSLIGLTSAQDLAAWIARRRMVADHGPAARHHHTTTTESIPGEKLHAF